MSVGKGLQGKLPWAVFLNYRILKPKVFRGRSEQEMPFIPPWSENTLFTLMKACGNHNNMLGLITVAELFINAGWLLYTLPSRAAWANLILCVYLKMRWRGKSSCGGSSELKIPLTCGAKAGSRGWGRTKASTMLALSTCIFLNFPCILPLSLIGLYGSDFNCTDSELSSLKLALRGSRPSLCATN